MSSDGLTDLTDEFDDIEVDADGKCNWADVANAQEHLRAQLRRLAAPIPQPAPGWDEATRAISFAMSSKIAALEAERAELMAQNDAATSWGAAVGARHERIKGINRQLEALRSKPTDTVATVADSAQSRVEAILLRRIYQEKIGGYTTETAKEILDALTNPAAAGSNASAILQNDLGEMLRALDMSDAAQPKSPHEVFQSAIAEMKRQLATASAEARLINASDCVSVSRDVLLTLISRLDYALGDTDPSIDPDYTDEEVKRDYPVFWVCQQLSALHGHASDCEKQGERLCTVCDAVIGAKSSVCKTCGIEQPSDRPADVTDLKTDPKLLDLLEKAKNYVMTPEEIYEQRRSFVRGMCPSNRDFKEWCAKVDKLLPPDAFTVGRR